MLYRAVFVYLASKCWSMEKLYRFLSVITALSAVMILSQRSAAQSAVSKVINFSMDEVTGIFMPDKIEALNSTLSNSFIAGRLYDINPLLVFMKKLVL